MGFKNNNLGSKSRQGPPRNLPWQPKQSHGPVAIPISAKSPEVQEESSNAMQITRSRMAMSEAPNTADKLTLWDRVILVGIIPLFFIRWLTKFAVHTNPALHWRQRLALTFLQAQRATFPPRHLLWLVRRVTTCQGIQQYCKDNGIPSQATALNAITIQYDGVDRDIPPPILHLLTPPGGGKNDTGPTLVYFHGGGYVNPLRAAAHMPLIMRCAAACRAKQVIVLKYALAPEHPYPAQFVQAVATLRHLVQDMALRPEDMILAGDSAGGQLVGALLAHLVHPSPYASELTIDGKFKAALFISPFVRVPSEGLGSYESNHGKDYLNRVLVDGFGAAWKANEGEIWASLCGGDGAAQIWSRVFARGPNGLVDKVMVTVGTAEIFLGCCRAFANDHVRAETVMITKKTDLSVLEGKDFVFAECEGEVHVQAALDSAVRYDGGTMNLAIASWLANL